MTKPSDLCRITVLTGLNAGYEAELPKGKLSIGGRDTDAIQLDGLSETLANFTTSTDKMKLRAHVDGVLANDNPCEPDRVADIKLPARIHLNDDISIFIANPHSGRSMSTAGKGALFASALGAAVFLSPIEVNVESTATANAVDGVDENQNPLPAAQVTLLDVPATQILSTDASCQNCAQEAERFLTKLFADEGLDGLNAKASEGTIRVTGKIERDHRPIWDSVRMSFDQKYAGSVPLLPSITTIVDEGAPFSIATVWLGEIREFTTNDGGRHRIGDLVQDNWVISAIEESFVELEREDKVLRIRF